MRVAQRCVASVVRVGMRRYTMARESGEHGHSGQRRSGFAAAQTVVVTLLTGIIAGTLLGYGLDRLLHTVPWFSAAGLFVGLGVALAAVFFETK